MNSTTNNIELIWEAFHDQLLRFILKKVHNKDFAEDILQSVFLKIISKIDTLKDSSKLKSWLYQIANNAITDHFREKKLTGPGEDDNFDPDDEVDGNINEEVGGWILPIIEELPEKYREALILSEINGISQKALASHLGISYEGAKSRVQRGRALIKDRLTQCCCFYIDKYGNILDYQRRDENCD